MISTGKNDFYLTFFLYQFFDFKICQKKKFGVPKNKKSSFRVSESFV
jgi:hypothetical protein